jgi:hypothetical protein
MMSFVLLIEEEVVRLRKRLKETSFKAKTSRVPFKKELVKELNIPVITDKYNHHMGAIDEFDHLIAQNLKLRPYKRGGSQALEHWLLHIVLVNCYLLALYNDVLEL